MAKATARPVIVCTQHRGVFYGLCADTAAAFVALKGARMAIQFGTTRGVMELAETGPTSRSKVSARADLTLKQSDVTAVFEVAPDAAKAWEAAK